ncbi:tail tape measure protein [Georhizobium profundi]|uniref:Tail tape measure protein n=1 Tax=Georhizobium profundi TaxID=2341112 RepID=A0A3S9B5Y1_9HYPH|nr:tail tape measure protein [Georhizobium profundi]AZN72251.1 tail tape measure protein [Georhizobium profundi]
MPRPDITAHIDANARGFHDALRRVRSDSDKTGQAAARSFANIAAKIRTGAAGIAGAAGLPVALSAASLGAAAVGVRQVALSIALVGDEARRAGVDVRSFQELKYVAEQNRIGVDSLTDGIKELNLRADEFITTGKGSAAEAFQRLGYDAEELRTKLQRPNELFIEIIGRLEQLDRSAQIRLADEIFGGTGGERFVQLIEQGEDGIRATVDEAHRLGLVMSEELIDRADELDRKFGALATTVSTGLKVAIIEAASALGRFIDEFRAFEDRTTENLRSRLNFAERNLAEAEERRTRLPGFLGRPLDLQIEKSRGEVDQITEELRKRAEADLRLGLARQRSQLENPVVPAAPVSNSGGGGSSRNASSMERERDAVRKLIADLQEELTLVHATEEAKRAAASSRQAGAAATDEERRQVVALNEQIYRETEALEAVEAARKDFADGMDQLSTDAVDALGNVIAGTEDAADAFKKLAIEIVKSALTGKGAYSDLFAALGKGNGGGGGVGGLLSAIFGGAPAFKANTTYGSFIGAPGFANGTDSAPGGLAWVGERGKELVNLPRGSQVIPNHDLSGLDGSSISAPVSISIDARGADREGLARVQGQLARLESELPARITRQVQQMPRDRIKGY